MFNILECRTILVTGGAGFIGSNFVNHFVPLFPNIRFVNLDKLTYAADISNIKVSTQNYAFEEGDIVDLDYLNSLFDKYKFDAVIHFAAESHVDLSIKNPGIFVQTNVLGTQNLLSMSLKYGVKRFHHVSTDEVYGDLPVDRPEIKFTESTPLAPNSPYSASKAGSDLMVRASIETFGLDAVITRCSNNYGQYQDKTKLIPKFICNLLTGQKVPLYAKGDNIRDWLYVQDHCEAIWEVFTRAKPGSIYNIGGNNEMTNMQITRKLLELTNTDESYIEYVADRLGHDMRYAIDASKIKNELGWEPRYTFEQGIAETVQYYKSSYKI